MTIASVATLPFGLLSTYIAISHSQSSTFDYDCHVIAFQSISRVATFTPEVQMYTVVHKKGATFIFSITLANIDGFS